MTGKKRTRTGSTPKRAGHISTARYRGSHQQQVAAQRRRVLWGSLAGLAGAALIVFVAVSAAPSHPQNIAPVVNAGNLPGLEITPTPWPPEYASLPARLAALDLPPNGDESYHIHAHLAIYVNGQPVTIPANVGISFADQLESPMHTHDTSGIIHVEASQPSDAFTLGAFFDIWGVKFTATQIGAYKDTNEKTVQVYIDGKPVPDPARYVLRPHDETVVGYGTPGSVPKTVPFTWPAGF